MNKISVITGGSSGLGFSLAKKLLTKGKDILIIGRNINKLNKAQMLLQNDFKHQKVYSFSCDISDEESLKTLEELIESQNLIVEYLFNNAGKGCEVNIKEITQDIIKDILNSNLIGMILMSSKILQITPDNEELTIINIMSTSALIGRENESVYCAAKWGARGFTESLRIELQGKKRNIIAVYPGGMITPFWTTVGSKRDISAFMDTDDVAEKIITIALNNDKSLVTDININRKNKNL